MQIVIDIPERIYKINKKRPLNLLDRGIVEKAVREGAPLSKEHGRLMILSEDKLKENQIALDFSCQRWISEVGISNATVAIIEADKTESEMLK